MTDNAAPAVNPNMEYRRLGDAGLRVSIFGFGSWVTFDNQVDDDLAVKCLAAAGAAGCNFFDNAEAYAGGKSEEIMGRAFKTLGWPRWSYVVTTKLFWGIHGEVPNMRNTLNRKYLLQAMEASLERFGLDYVDVVYCHRADPNTPLEETVRAMSDIVDRGQATYWGTSEWSADEIRAAIEIADHRNLHAPVTEQSQYNLFERTKVEKEYARLWADHRYGNTIWSPLASGLLTGKYANGIPEGSRGALAGYEWLADSLSDSTAIQQVENLRPIAERLDCSMAQLAIAWTSKHPMVSSVITGASKVEQVEQNFAALGVIPKLTDDVMAEIDAAFAA